MCLWLQPLWSILNTCLPLWCFIPLLILAGYSFLQANNACCTCRSVHLFIYCHSFLFNFSEFCPLFWWILVILHWGRQLCDWQSVAYTTGCKGLSIKKENIVCLDIMALWCDVYMLFCSLNVLFNLIGHHIRSSSYTFFSLPTYFFSFFLCNCNGNAVMITQSTFLHEKFYLHLSKISFKVILVTFSPLRPPLFRCTHITAPLLLKAQ